MVELRRGRMLDGAEELPARRGARPPGSGGEAGRVEGRRSSSARKCRMQEDAECRSRVEGRRGGARYHHLRPSPALLAMVACFVLSTYPCRASAPAQTRASKRESQLSLPTSRSIKFGDPIPLPIPRDNPPPIRELQPDTDRELPQRSVVKALKGLFEDRAVWSTLALRNSLEDTVQSVPHITPVSSSRNVQSESPDSTTDTLLPRAERALSPSFPRSCSVAFQRCIPLVINHRCFAVISKRCPPPENPASSRTSAEPQGVLPFPKNKVHFTRASCVTTKRMPHKAFLKLSCKRQFRTSPSTYSSY